MHLGIVRPKSDLARMLLGRIVLALGCTRGRILRPSRPVFVLSNGMGLGRNVLVGDRVGMLLLGDVGRMIVRGGRNRRLGVLVDGAVVADTVVERRVGDNRFSHG